MYKILIADDEPKVIQLINALIDWTRLDIELVGTVRDGKSAFNEIERLKPDIVITDIRMPGYDGIELIRRVRQLDFKVDFIIVSGYQHFDYAHNAIKYDVKDYLLKPLKKDEINQTLKKMIDKYKNDSMTMLESQHLKSQFKKDRLMIRESYTKQLFEDHTQVVDSDNIEGDYYVRFNRSHFRIICIKPDISFKEGQEEILKLLLEKTEQQVLKTITPYTSDMILYDEKGYLYVLINYDAEDSGLLRNGLVTIVNEIHALRDLFQNVSVTLALSNEFVDMSSFGPAFTEVKSRILDKVLSSTNRIIDTSYLKEKIALEQDYFNKETKDSFVNLIRELNIDKFDHALKKWASVLALSKNISGANHFKLSYMLLEVIIDTLSRFELLEESYLTEHRYSETELHMEHTVYALYENVSVYACDLLSRAYEKRKQNNLQPVTEAIKYIDDHYAEAISLELISSNVGFNASYFSTLFKRETGKNFLEYLTLVRMEEAKRILSEGQVKTGEIGHLCGYSDGKYFAKQFKKHTGLTPSQYKKLYF